MKFLSPQSKKEFLEDLQQVTCSGSPNLASLPSLVPLAKFQNQNPFYGIISNDSFHLSIKDGASGPITAMNGVIIETDDGIDIQTRFSFLFIPTMFLSMVIALFFVAGTVLLVLTMRPEPLFCHAVGLVVLLIVNNGVKKEKYNLISRFKANTTAIVA